MRLDERQKINHKLKSLGFGGLDDPMIFAQIATLYKTHESFRGLLMSTAPDQRRIAYEALRPHLCFTAKPLDIYEQEIKLKAEQEQWDVWNGTPYPDHFKPSEIETPEYKLQRLAEEAIADKAFDDLGELELVCKKCTLGATFKGKDRKQATHRAYLAGWRVWEKKTYCPEHAPRSN
jgi:hypothetical protein